jgi:hypothetical protein
MIAIFPNQTKAEETGPSKELIIQEAEPTITKLGGTFRTVKNGTYSAIANGYSYFEVK